MFFTLRHGGHVGAHLQKNFNELLLLCAPTWPSWALSFESHRTEGHVSENHLYQTFSKLHPAPLQFPESDLVAYCWWYDGGLGRK